MVCRASRPILPETFRLLPFRVSSQVLAVAFQMWTSELALLHEASLPSFVPDQLTSRTDWLQVN
jgi:hypothetical protein